MSLIEKNVVIVGDGASGKTCLLRVFFEDIYPEVYVPTVFDTFKTLIEIDDKPVKLVLWDTAGQDEYDRLRTISYRASDVVIICYSIDTPSSLINVVDKWIPEVQYLCKANVPVILVGNKKDIRDQWISDQEEKLKAKIDKFGGSEVGEKLENTSENEDFSTETTVLIKSKKSVDQWVLNKIINKKKEEGMKKTVEPMVSKVTGQDVAKTIGADAFFECSAKTREGVRDVFNAAIKASQRDNKQQCVIV